MGNGGAVGLLYMGPYSASRPAVDTKVRVGLVEEARSFVRVVVGGTERQRNRIREKHRAKSALKKLKNQYVHERRDGLPHEASRAKHEAARQERAGKLSYQPRPRKQCVECGKAKFRAEFLPKAWSSSNPTCRTCASSFLCEGCGAHVAIKSKVHSTAKTCETCASSWVCTRCNVLKGREEFGKFYWSNRLTRKAANQAVSCKACAGGE